ncbi:isopeptide-forming domain-containing fimbrial protein [Eggerthellaceae bacterium zg-887]|uniref:isopeptide-forming domain-containing fimbrial protein n=1 Tax=Xiamenia xianingshaonis TaxID=2682776 RepID=UPI00140C7B66|nr:isopeptide-forming domain-containing fimbrial protein [Xiamenia xianingshaonis]NHM16332.1 isopeptide-forming domain-containing fimbrial protein [Xiamenia xianingshaonis]
MKRKLLAVICSVVMAMTMCVGVAFAEGESKTLTVNGSEGYTFSAYQIFKGDASSKATGTETTAPGNPNVLANIEWPDESGTMQTAVEAAWEAAGLNGDSSLAQPPSSNATAGDWATAIGQLQTNSEQAKAFAAQLVKHIEDNNLSTSYTATIADNGTSAQMTMPQGYYLVVTKAPNDLETTPQAEGMLALVGDTSIVAKVTDEPTFEKKVKDINDSTDTDRSGWQDGADWDIGDKVPFKLSATLPSNYDRYSTYSLNFKDTLSSGLTLQFDTVKVFYQNGTDAPVEITGQFNKPLANQAGGSFEVGIENLKSISGITNGTVVYVEYSAELNTNATTASTGNKNEASLEFSNNPDDATSVGETPTDTVVVFTFKTTVNKVDQNNDALTGAAFKLEKQLEDASWQIVKEFHVDASNPASSFEFKGLDDGTYRLTETVTPEGYNTIEPVTFEIESTHTETSKNGEIILTDVKGTGTNGLTFTPDVANGSLTTQVQNNSGSVLPSTGGIGTTIFYVVGACLVVIAGVALVAKRRAAARRK